MHHTWIWIMKNIFKKRMWIHFIRNLLDAFHIFLWFYIAGYDALHPLWEVHRLARIGAGVDETLQVKWWTELSDETPTVGRKRFWNQNWNLSFMKLFTGQRNTTEMCFKELDTCPLKRHRRSGEFSAQIARLKSKFTRRSEFQSRDDQMVMKMIFLSTLWRFECLQMFSRFFFSNFVIFEVSAAKKFLVTLSVQTKPPCHPVSRPCRGKKWIRQGYVSNRFEWGWCS